MSPSDPRYHQQYYPAMHTSMGPKGMISMPHMQMGPGKHPHRQGGPPLQKSMMPRSNDGKSPKKKGSVRPPGGIVNSLNNPNSIAHGNAALSAAILRGVTMRPYLFCSKHNCIMQESPDILVFLTLERRQQWHMKLHEKSLSQNRMGLKAKIQHLMYRALKQLSPLRGKQLLKGSMSPILGP